MMPSTSSGAPGSAALVAIHRLDQLELPALLPVHDLRLQVRHVSQIVDACALEVGGKECAAVVHGTAEVGRRVDRDVPRQVLVLGSQPVQEPGPHARPGEGGIRAAGVQLDHGLGVGRRVGVKSAKPAELVGVDRPCGASARRTTSPTRRAGGSRTSRRSEYRRPDRAYRRRSEAAACTRRCPSARSPLA